MAQEEVKLSPVFEFSVLIREGHLDTFGHVNNATYLQIFEEARWDIVSARGYDLAYVLSSGIGPTILEVNLKFRREIRNREKIRVQSWIYEIKRKTMNLRQIMINERGESAAIADFVIGLFDLKARSLIEPTPEWLKALELPAMTV